MSMQYNKKQKRTRRLRYIKRKMTAAKGAKAKPAAQPAQAEPKAETAK